MLDTITLTITDRAGRPHHIEAPSDMNLNLMEICRIHDLGVEGTCGGMALCASCQIYINSSATIPSPSEAEMDMLDQAFHVRKNSRLGCQIKINDHINGLEFEIAPQ